MGKLLFAENSKKEFRRLGMWKEFHYTIIARNNRFAEYADNFDSKDERLKFTYIQYKNMWLPFNRFKLLDTPIKLVDGTEITMKDNATNFYIELNPGQDAVRLYEEVT